MEMPQDRLAFDRAASARTYDADGHLHVTNVPISKAAVNPYRGSEIPNWQGLGLDGNRIYQLLRDPAELEKAAASFNGKPLLNLHKPQTAADHDHDLHVGSVHNVFWDPPYLRAGDLHVLDGESVAGIETDEQRELSSSYRYTADMTPGTFNGVAHDGVMRGILGNHVALVRSGRAGPDVFVSDAALTPSVPTPAPTPTARTTPMATIATPLPRKALLASGALLNHVRPMLAADKAIDMIPVFAGVTGKNFTAQRSAIAARFKTATAGKLAQDADVGDVAEVLAALEPVLEMLGDDPDTPAPAAAVDDDNADMKAAMSACGVSDDVIAAVCAKLSDGSAAEPAAMDDKDTAAKKDDKPAMDTVSKPAMDAAIARARQDAVSETIARVNAMHEARSLVRPIVGEVVAMDSAGSVLRFALESKGYAAPDLAGVPDKALVAMVRNLPTPEAAPRSTPRVAMDAAAATRRAEMFPNAARFDAR